MTGIAPDAEWRANTMHVLAVGCHLGFIPSLA